MARSFGHALKIAEPVLQAANYCAVYGFIGDKFEDHWQTQACHARLREGNQKEVKYYYTGYHTDKYAYGTKDIGEYKLTEVDLTHFSQYTIGDNSPFKEFLGDRQRQLVFNGDKCTGVLIETSPDDDLDNLFAFSVMCRYTNEKIPGFNLMLKLIAEGLHPSEAWYICHFFSANKDGVVSPQKYWASGHTNFSDLKIDLNRLIKGDPYKGTVKVKKDPRGEYPTCIARFADGRNISKVFSNEVKPSGSITGRWSSTKGKIDVKAILNSWETYRNDLLTA